MADTFDVPNAPHESLTWGSDDYRKLVIFLLKMVGGSVALTDLDLGNIRQLDRYIIHTYSQPTTGHIIISLQEDT